ncbi:MAG: peroxiredoxin [Actinomycetota bacterium]|jgi:peroxiredoxin Q/BCP|nr:peroxiredoxin [Actinomycetota bacterium]
MRVGDVAADFELPDHNGRVVRLSEELSGGPVVLFFYPRAFTRGCTEESCHFRDLYIEIKKAGATCLGISADPVERQARFAEKHLFQFPLLSDVNRTVAKAFGVKRPGPLFNRRSTFVIARDRTILGIIHDEVHMGNHADQALQILSSDEHLQSG